MAISQHHIHLDRVPPIAGFATVDAPPETYLWILTRAFVCSDEPMFYLYCDQISRMFLRDCFIDAINKFLVVIHADLSADVYANDFPIQVKILAKRDVSAGEPLGNRDIADISELRFPGIDIKESDSVIFCFKKGWKFGLFFDLNPLDKQSVLDVNRLFRDLASHYRYLAFQELYSIAENQPLFESILVDGWFPFIQLLGGDFEDLAKLYARKSDLSSGLPVFLNRFDRGRIYSFAGRWWNDPFFAEKKPILEAGIDACLAATEAGYINCLKTLYSEIEGIVRIRYVDEEERKPTFKELIDYVNGKAEGKFTTQGSLGFPAIFYRYLNETVFQSFDLATGQVDLSRHSVSHGVAEPAKYTRAKAIQAILTLDQMYFYLT